MANDFKTVEAVLARTGVTLNPLSLHTLLAAISGTVISRDPTCLPGGSTVKKNLTFLIRFASEFRMYRWWVSVPRVGLPLPPTEYDKTNVGIVC